MVLGGLCGAGDGYISAWPLNFCNRSLIDAVTVRIFLAKSNSVWGTSLGISGKIVWVGGAVFLLCPFHVRDYNSPCDII